MADKDESPLKRPRTNDQGGEKAASGSVTTICLTGGPCAGKTTSIDHIRAHYKDQGVRVYVVPEVATMFFESGAHVDDLGSRDYSLLFQDELLRAHMYLLKSICTLAEKCGSDAVVIADRGTMDGKAYMAPEAWQDLLKMNDTTEDKLCSYYDSVLHLVTTADGAEHAYSLENNGTRTETAEEARVLDSKTAACWTGHKKLTIVDNSTGFEGKVKRILAVLKDVVGK